MSCVSCACPIFEFTAFPFVVVVASAGTLVWLVVSADTFVWLVVVASADTLVWLVVSAGTSVWLDVSAGILVWLVVSAGTFVWLDVSAGILVWLVVSAGTFCLASCFCRHTCLACCFCQFVSCDIIHVVNRRRRALSYCQLSNGPELLSFSRARAPLVLLSCS